MIDLPDDLIDLPNDLINFFNHIDLISNMIDLPNDLINLYNKGDDNCDEEGENMIDPITGEIKESSNNRKTGNE